MQIPNTFILLSTILGATTSFVDGAGSAPTYNPTDQPIDQPPTDHSPTTLAPTFPDTLTDQPSDTNTDGIDFTCNVVADSCPSQRDGVCDDPALGGSKPECRNQDCLDCDRAGCGQFNNNCGGCVSAPGCYYCPEEATCNNSDRYTWSRPFFCRVRSDDYLSSVNGDTPDQCIEEDNVYLDPQWQGSKWAYEMVNLIALWEQYDLRGRGVAVRINDEGVFAEDPEFAGRFVAEDSCPGYNVINPDDDHGTRAIGIVAANADNNLCGAGIAPEVKFSACNLDDRSSFIYQKMAFKRDSYDISTNSWGFPACNPNQPGAIEGEDTIIWETGCPFQYSEQSFLDPCAACDGQFTASDRVFTNQCKSAIFNHCRYYYKEDPEACADFPELIVGTDCNYDKVHYFYTDVIVDGTLNGRDGKGIIWIFSSGNSFYKLDDVNFSSFTNHRYTISVGALGRDGLHSDYSTAGAALTVTAPAGDSDGFELQTVVAVGDGTSTCGTSGQGTSFSAPVVTGIVALMLEANPELTWRDVQGILAETSQSVTNDPYDPTGVTNAAGIWHSNWYGWGIIDALASVEAAYSWDLYSEELMILGSSPQEDAIIDDTPGNEFVTAITLNPVANNYPEGFIMESVAVFLQLEHFQRGDLELELISPSGTSSILHPGNRRENNQPTSTEYWKLTTLRNWGEDPNGVWQLRVCDLVDRDRQDAFPLESSEIERGIEGLSFEGVEYYENRNLEIKNQRETSIKDNKRKEPRRKLQTVEPNVFRQWEIIVYGRAPSDGTDNPSGAPTKAPTESPTDAPTNSPTVSPTESPTDAPTNPPTVSPTESPTDAPTNPPTVIPTESPTDAPTNPPTNSPTESPTDAPTNSPTESPTDAPTKSPTESPTDAPTNSPTESPTDAPTKSPTESPTDALGDAPTDAPVTPTDAPVDPPTNAPVANPTAAPIQGCSSVYTVPQTAVFADLVNDCLQGSCPEPNLKCWDTSQVTDMSNAFSGERNFNTNISGWDTSSVTSMNNMFKNAKKFNQDIGGWDVSNVQDMSGMFNGGSKFNKDINGWDVSSVTTMSEMFKNTKIFNKSLDSWDVSKVESMLNMFQNAKKFNQPLDIWDTTSVSNMNGMFKKAKLFNQCLSTWAGEFASRKKNQMFQQTGCSGESTPPDSGPWCQTEEQDGCFVDLGCNDRVGGFVITKQTSCAAVAALDISGQMDACLGSPEVLANCPTICDGACEVTAPTGSPNNPGQPVFSQPVFSQPVGF